VRGTGSRTSLFAAGTGQPPASGPWPEPDGYPVQLPPVFPADEWVAPADLEAPLMVESEAFELLEACARELERELPGARLLRAVLDDGASSSSLASSLGVDATTKARSATLYLETGAPGDSGEQVTELLAEREARRFSPRLVARRLADRLIVRTRGQAVGRDRGQCLLAPAVSVRILGGLLPLLVGPEAAVRARERADRQGRLGTESLSIVDDPRLPEGLFASAVDGEGVPTRTQTLVDEGIFRRPLLAWWQQEGRTVRPAGCLRRPGWREPPRLGPSHLFIQPDRTTSVQSMLAALVRGYYLLEALPGVEFDLEGDRFRLPVSGFQVSNGQAGHPVSRVALQGRISALLHGVRAVGRDLTLVPVGGVLGAPTMLIQGLEIVAA
jgi:PmbA protein